MVRECKAIVNTDQRRLSLMISKEDEGYKEFMKFVEAIIDKNNNIIGFYSSSPDLIKIDPSLSLKESVNEMGIIIGYYNKEEND